MTRPSRALILTLSVVLISLPAFGQPHDMAAGNADSDMMAGMNKMNHDMAGAPMTGDADHDFVAMMVPHHQGAIDMARVELQDGKDPALRRLATEIVAAQRKEIAMMKRWQAEHPAR